MFPIYIPRVRELFSKFTPVPEEWFEEVPDGETPSGKPLLKPIDCELYSDLIGAWSAKGAMEWKETLDISLSCLLAIAASTRLQGDQVWGRLLGIAGTAKTTLCEALAVNKEYTYPMSLLTGLHSGYKGEGAGDDASLIPKIMNKTAIINEGDMLLKAPNRDQIMAELRDLYSGIARCTYRNGKHVVYDGIRTTVILAGTPTLRVLNKSALGDRFLDCIIYERESDHEERSLVRNILNNTLEESITESGEGENGKSWRSPELLHAYQKTGGYLGFLRQTLSPTLRRMVEQRMIYERLTEDCESLGLLVAAMRTRPIGGDEEETEKELHIRLSKQLRKLALCLAVVMNRALDMSVMKRVAKIARDTCYGNTYKICVKLLQGPLDTRGLSIALSVPEDKIRKAVGVLLSLRCVRRDNGEVASGAFGRRASTFRLSQQMVQLLNRLKVLLGVHSL